MQTDRRIPRAATPQGIRSPPPPKNKPSYNAGYKSPYNFCPHSPILFFGGWHLCISTEASAPIGLSLHSVITQRLAIGHAVFSQRRMIRASRLSVLLYSCSTGVILINIPHQHQDCIFMKCTNQGSKLT